MNGHSSVPEHMSRVQGVLSVACTVLIVTFKVVSSHGARLLYLLEKCLFLSFYLSLSRSNKDLLFGKLKNASSNLPVPLA